MAISRQSNCSTRFQWDLWQKLFPAPAKRLNFIVKWANAYNRPLPTPLLALIAYASDTPALAAADTKHRLYLPLTLRAHPR